MQKRKLVIRPADVWHQPDFKDVHQLKVNERVVQDVAGTVLMLNDDCLEKIFKYLPMRDLLKAERVCWRFRSIAEMIYKTFKVFDSEPYQEFSVMELRSLIYNIGPYCHSLYVKFYVANRNLQVLRFAAQYCTSVTALHLCGIEISYKIKNIQNLFRNLTKLEIEACSMSDQSLIYLMKASENDSITELNLSSNHELTGKSLQMFRHLRVANLYSATNIQPKHFLEFVRGNPTLEDLNIVLCGKITPECMQAIAKLPCLKKLAISNGYSGIASNGVYSVLKQLKTLTHLKISYVNYGVLDKFLMDLSEEVPLEFLDISSGHMTKSCLDAILNFKTLRGLVLNHKKDCDDTVLCKLARLRTLEELSIASCHNVTDKGVEEIVRLNPQLQKIDVSSCQYLSQELIESLVVITKDRPHVLTMRVGGSSLTVFEEEPFEITEKKVGENLKLEMSSPFSSYPGSSDETSSDDWMDDYNYWDNGLDDDDDWDDDSDGSGDSEYAGRLLLEILMHGGL